MPRRARRSIPRHSLAHYPENRRDPIVPYDGMIRAAYGGLARGQWLAYGVA
jgi:hypothetical protein